MKRTKTQLEALVASLERENTLLLQFLSAKQNEKPDAQMLATEKDGVRYCLRLYRSTGAAGGIVEAIYKVKGQKDQVVILTLDNAAEHLRRDGIHTEYDSAISRLCAIRSEKVSAAAQLPGHPPTVEDAQRLIAED